MKDRVFIVWSGANDVARCVKNILESDYNYVCIIGGNSENNSAWASVGDTVIQQMKSCNQAIVIFQNNNNGVLSNNLFFELGYSYASYGAKKVHCVKREADSLVLPSDFDNSFVEPIKNSDTVEAFATGIVEYFINRQKMSVNENKMFLIDNRYMIHEKLLCHYSEIGSKCSDYELAQYILFYMQATQMFNDVPRVYDEVLNFKRKNSYLLSKDLDLSVTICLSFLEMLMNVREREDNQDVFIDEETLFVFKKAHRSCLKSLTDDDTGIFDEWARAFVNQQLCFGYMLFGNNVALDDESRRNAYEASVRYGEAALSCIEELERMKVSKENRDDRGILVLFRAYVFRNIYIAKKYLGEEDATRWIKDSLDQRELLKSSFGQGTIDTQIYNTFCMEYYLALISYIEDVEDNEMDEFDISMHKKRMREYLRSVEENKNVTAYLHMLRKWCDGK